MNHIHIRLKEYLLVLVQTEKPIGMNKVICPWVSGEGFTPEHEDRRKLQLLLS